MGRSDHSHVRLLFDTSVRVPGFDVSKVIPLKSRVDWTADCS